MTTTATEHATLTTDQIRALPLGARVEVKDRASREAWQTGTVVELGHTPLVVFDGPYGSHAFGWGKTHEGAMRHAWHIGGEDSIVRHADAPGAFAFGDRVQFTRGSRTYTATVIGRYESGGNVTWLVADDSLPTDSDPYAYRRTEDRGAGSGFTFISPWPQPNPLSGWVPESDLSRVSDAPEVPVSNTDEARRILRTIGEALADTADRSEWCGEYERLLGQLVDSLPHGTLRDTFAEAASRATESGYEVEVTYTVSGTYTVTVTAMDGESAEEMVREDPWAYIDSFSLRSGVSSDDVEFESFEVQ